MGLKPKLVKAQAKNDCTIYYKDDPYGVTMMAHRMIKGQTIEREMFSSAKIENRTIASILGDRNVILRDGSGYISTYSGDFDYIPCN